jgi:hypothetical protein
MLPRCTKIDVDARLTDFAPAEHAHSQSRRVLMAKGQKKGNREAKKPKKDKSVATVQTSIIPTSGRLVPPKTAGRVSG